MAKRTLKPLPKRPDQVVQENITPYLTDRGKGDSTTIYSENRAENISTSDSNVKDFSVTLHDIDNALLYYFKNVIKPSISQNGQRIEVPIIYNNAELWNQIQKEGYSRDKNGKLMAPYITFKRNFIEKNRNIGNKLDGNQAHLLQIFENKYSKRNIHDKFNILTNRIPQKELHAVITPDYVTITYECVIFTDFLIQNDKIVESVQYASDSYWGDPNRFKFKARIDSFTNNVDLQIGEDRAAKTTFTITLNGYVIPDSVNKYLSTDIKKIYSKSQITFGFETVEGLVNNYSESIKRKSPMGATSYVDSYNINKTVVQSIGNDVLIYLNTNIPVKATIITSSTAIFPKGALSAPNGLPATSVDNFTFFVNGQLVEKDAISSFIYDINSSTLTINENELGYSLSPTDEIVAIGKFKN